MAHFFFDMSFLNISTLLSALSAILPVAGTMFERALVMHVAEPVTSFSSNLRYFKQSKTGYAHAQGHSFCLS